MFEKNTDLIFDSSNLKFNSVFHLGEKWHKKDHLREQKIRSPASVIFLFDDQMIQQR